MDYQYDVIIVGAGVAGALCAWRLSQQSNLRILIIDAGANELDDNQRKEFVSTFAVATNKSQLSPYAKLESNKYAVNQDGGDKFTLNRYYVQPGPDLLKSAGVRIVGGSTWAWRGNSPRFIPSDFKLKTLYGIAEDWPVTYDDLEPYFCEAEIALGVAGNDAEWANLLEAYRSKPFPMPNIAESYGSQLVRAAIDGMEIDGKVIKVVSTPQARNSQDYDGRPACQGNSNCIPICPSAAKYDASIHLRKAQANGVELRKSSVVTQLKAEANGDVNTVFFKDWSTPDKKEQSLTGKIIVLATHAIETPKLWLFSKLGNKSDQVGRNLMDHLAEEVTGLFPKPVFPFRGPQSTSSIEVFRDGKFRKFCGAFRMTVGNDAWGRKEHPFKSLENLMVDEKKGIRFGKALRSVLEDRITRMVRIGYSTEMLPNKDNRVTLADEKDAFDIIRPKITFKVDDYSKKALAYGYSVAKRIFDQMKGEEEVDPIAPTLDYNGAGHPMGTCRMGSNPCTSVVDSQGRSHEHQNLYVVGSSVFVTGATANPTITIAALALRTADAIKSNLTT
ncbi:MAG: GMC family oxidoreductase [Acaryochloridaceae cyanobacterium RU_4_10]|nr:GMC family oxidoreductase [Acaryochloridaceae cyanobacterium RU_4_10]